RAPSDRRAAPSPSRSLPRRWRLHLLEDVSIALLARTHRLLGLFPGGRVHDRPDHVLGIASRIGGGRERGMEVSRRPVWTNDATIEVVVGLLADGSSERCEDPGSVVRMDTPKHALGRRDPFFGIEAEQ